MKKKNQTLIDLLKFKRFVLEGNSYLNERSEIIEKPLIVSEDEYFEYLMEQKRVLSKAKNYDI